MKVKVFIDGSSGTTGLRIADRLAARPEIELLSISAEGRKDVHERAKVINSADLAFLCLPDAASKEVMPLLRPDVKVLDTSTAFRTDAAWDYGFPELKGQKEKIQNSYRVAVPGCYAIGYTPGDFSIDKVCVWLSSKAGEVYVCENAAYHPYSEDEAAKVLAEHDILVKVDMGTGEASAKAWGCDLTYDYVKINGDYRT